MAAAGPIFLPEVNRTKQGLTASSEPPQAGGPQRDEPTREYDLPEDTLISYMSVIDTVPKALSGHPLDRSLFAGKAVLVVNVASHCGLTPQYASLEELHERYKDRGFTVLGVPCNQFGGQEPGSPEEIAAFCSTNYGVTFPLTEKVDVNGEQRHPLYQALTKAPDGDGEAGDIQWNFEKFLISPDGEVVARFRPGVVPSSGEVVAAVESVLPS